ncbi:hypothetical protein BCR42DRAFT_329198 [Absidia repens]|uniref:TPR-like protein n=1 Tax=Absidia repens TaxID=90262 RepID=A0A1X2IDM2_9FUNG|nr:hypothetical protein BCR42DRAFT_329198 [Absidia repens]
MLDATKETRKRLKTGAPEEFENDFADFEDNLLATATVGKKRNKALSRVGKGEARLPKEVSQLLGRANGYYLSQDYGKAIDILQETITQYPNYHQPWNTLGLVHEEMGNTSKSLEVRMVAAHMSANDVSLWKELGLKSIDNNAKRQAVYCFDKALALDPLDVDVLWDRSFLQKDMGKLDAAMDGFQQILEILPFHFKVINELAQLYRIKGETRHAITLYEDAMAHHVKHAKVDSEENEANDEDDNPFSDKLGYPEINMLSELYLMVNDYRRALDCIKTGIRHVQQRQHELKWLDRPDDDDEYLPSALERQNIPLELRVRMGVCRIYLGQAPIARQHFEYLYQNSPSIYPDLYQDVACAYMDRRFFDKALAVFQKIIDAKDEVEVDLLIRTAECYREVGDLETAMVFFVNALELVDYVVRKTREIRQKKRLEALAAELALETAERLNNIARKKGSLFDESLARQQLKNEKELKREQRRREEDERQMDALKLFEKINELHEMLPPLVVETDRNIMREYIRVAQRLWDDFRTTKAFFPYKQKVLHDGNGFYASRNRKTRVASYSIHEARTLATRLRQRSRSKKGTIQEPLGFYDDDEEDDDEEDDDDDEEEAYNKELNKPDHFRNIWLDDWIDIFIKLSYMLTTLHRSEEAFIILRTAIVSKPVYSHPVRKTVLKLALLGCGMIADNRTAMIDVARWLCNAYQFENDTYRIYGTIFPSGLQDKLDFGPIHALKYFIRNIKLMDGLHGMYTQLEKGEPVNRKDEAQKMKELQDVIRTMQLDPKTTGPDDYERYYNVTEEVQGNGQIKDWMEPLAEVSPLLITLFGHILMIGSNFIGASIFYMRAYALEPNDPLITLSLGIANLLRSTQRITDDRHLQILKGMQMLSYYCKLRNHNQEAEYNLGRAYHLLNLTHLAVPHYERALILPSAAKQGGLFEPKSIDDVYTWPVPDDGNDDNDDEDETDLKREAAYNLHLIYMTSGATTLAQILLLKYCSI